ncbi:MAG TPA: hypothetical protein VE053_09190 [Allosphingosinicella sp.]|nr:hypothetical protein [Allosphingosinicella sp.]
MLLRVTLAVSLFLFVSLAASQPTRPEAPPEIERIAIVGHGIAFDSKMRRIPIDVKTIRSMQSSLLGVLAKSRLTGQPGIQSFAARIESAMAKARSEEEKAILTGILIRRQLEGADQRARAAYDWRNNFLIERSRSLLDRRFNGRYQISETVLRLLREGGLILAATQTAYMSECRGQDVPVPPNFSMSSPGAWVNRGNLTYNILSPGDSAQVWTWTDPARRGACVALPRDGGGPGTLAGIICQSATTGKACFWDNLTRANPTRRVPPATETMVIRDLQDGKTLDVGAPCTGCHTGNNVFLMSPDDSTWAKLMRGPLPDTTNFSTIYEPQANTVAGGPRYTPIAHASWVNPALTTGCAGSCHGSPSGTVQGIWSGLPAAQKPQMPPACATGGNFRNCYDTP